MNKVLGIFSKKNKLEMFQFSEMINSTDNHHNKYSNEKKYSDYFYLKNYGSSKSSDHVLVKSDTAYAYSGFIYFPFTPKITENLNKQVINHISKTLINYKNFIRCKGNYNIIKYNINQNQLIISNDQFGFFPLFIYNDSDIFIFCNDFEPIIKFKKHNLKINTNSIWEYFLCGSPLNDKTFFCDINMMPAGHTYHITQKYIKIKRQYQKLLIKKNKKKIEEVADLYYKTFKSELSQILNWSDDKLSITLTGGTDTRMILGAMGEKERKKRNFVTWKSNYINDYENKDILIANMLATRYQLNHSVIPNPLYSITYPNKTYFSQLKNNGEFVISGYMGSETLRFEPSYPTNISLLVRQIIKSDFQYDKHNDLLIELNNNCLKANFNYYKEFLNDYIKCTYNYSLNEQKKEIFDTVSNIKSPFKEIPYTNFYLTRSLFSRHSGGAASNMIMPAYSSRCLISPFISTNILKIIWSIHPKHLNSTESGLSNMILKQNFSDFCDIDSNSHLTHFTNTVLKKYDYGKNAVYYNKINYNMNKIKHISNNKLHVSLFHIDKINSDFLNSEKKFIWHDLYNFLDYCMP